MGAFFRIGGINPPICKNACSFATATRQARACSLTLSVLLANGSGRSPAVDAPRALRVPPLLVALVRLGSPPPFRSTALKKSKGIQSAYGTLAFFFVPCSGGAPQPRGCLRHPYPFRLPLGAFTSPRNRFGDSSGCGATFSGAFAPLGVL